MQKMKLQPVKPNGTDADGEAITVPYAPTELAFTKSAHYAEVPIPGLELPLQQFVRGEAETISLEIFLDATDGSSASVTGAVRDIYKLATIKSENHAPPLVKVSWGDDFPGPSMGTSEQSETEFLAIVLSVSRRYTLFGTDGAPLRAVVTISLRQYATLEQQISALSLQSADHTRVHVVQQGENLPLIAFDAYANAAAWRMIATHNNLDDVRNVPPGTRLELPPLEALT